VNTISEYLEWITSGLLTGAAIAENLVESEGQQGSAHVNSVGHPLQHIAVLESTTGGFQEIKTAYHKRGPKKFHGVTNTVANMGGPKAHSQFKTQFEAERHIAAALNSAGGKAALEKLKNPMFTVKLTYGVTDNETFFGRTANVFADPAGPQQNMNFVLITPSTTKSIVLELHHSRRTLEGLHFQSAYPTNSTSCAGGSCQLEITTWPGKAVATLNL